MVREVLTICVDLTGKISLLHDELSKYQLRFRDITVRMHLLPSNLNLDYMERDRKTNNFSTKKFKSIKSKDLFNLQGKVKA